MDTDDPDVQADELTWVECTELGAVQLNSAQLAAAGENWEKAAGIAERFDEGDPRLAASLNNLAVIARFARRLDDADQWYRQALQVWDQTEGWIERMQLAPRARSSLFHMRLESRHRAQFALWALDEYFKKLPRGAAVTMSNHAEWHLFTGKQAQARSLYRRALEHYAATPEAPARGAEAIRRNATCLADAQRATKAKRAGHAVWAPGLDSPFSAAAEREGWIIDRPPEFTDEGRFMAGLMCVYLIEQTRAAVAG